MCNRLILFHWNWKPERALEKINEQTWQIKLLLKAYRKPYIDLHAIGL
jgi:hypothetical protein